ncbi:MAG: hypothetical protein WBL63_12510 [Candidatus Acidiferrum sp.]
MVEDFLELGCGLVERGFAGVRLFHKDQVWKNNPQSSGAQARRDPPPEQFFLPRLHPGLSDLTVGPV